MQARTNVSSQPRIATPSLPLAFLGFATSTVGMVWIITPLDTLA